MVKKDSLIKGTLILTAAALVARVLGIFQRVPLQYAMDRDGQNAFGLANNVYLLLLIFATAGIPSAISKMVSERLELGREAEVKRIYRAAIGFGAVAGLVMTTLLLIIAPYYANSSDVPEATFAIRAVAPSLLLFPVIAMMRGYFQGRQFMLAGGVSQIVEQIARVSTAVALVFALQGWGYDNTVMAAGGAFGSVLGSVGAFAVMLWYAFKLRQGDRQRAVSASDSQPSAVPAVGGPVVLTRTRQIYAAIFKTSIPILLTAMTVQLIYNIDSNLLVPLARGKFGVDTAKDWLSVLVTNAQAIAGIPPVLAIALSTSILPVLAAAFASGDAERVHKQTSLAIRIAIFSGMPIVLLMSVGANPVNGLLFSSAKGSAIVGILSAGTIFQITMMTTNSILYGLSRQRQAMAHTLTGIALKFTLTLVLTPFFGVYGLLAATSACFLGVTIWNMVSIRSLTGVKALGDRWAGFATAVAILVAVGSAISYYGIRLLEPLGWKWPYLFTTGLLGIVLIAAYPVLLVSLGVIRAEDLESYPARIKRLLKPFLRFNRQRVRQNG